MTNSDNMQVEELGQGIKLESKYHATYRLVAFTVSQWDRKATDLWSNRSVQLVKETAPDITLLILNDFAHAGSLLVVSPYTKARINDIYAATKQYRPQSRAFVALVVGSKFLTPLLNTFLPAVESGTLVKTRPFHDRDQAMSWLIAMGDQTEG